MASQVLWARVAALAVGTLVQALGEGMAPCSRVLSGAIGGALGGQAWWLVGGVGVRRGLGNGRMRQRRRRGGRGKRVGDLGGGEVCLLVLLELVSERERCALLLLLLLLELRRRLVVSKRGGGDHEVVLWAGGSPAHIGRGAGMEQVAQRVGRHVARLLDSSSRKPAGWHHRSLTRSARLGASSVSGAQRSVKVLGLRLAVNRAETRCGRRGNHGFE